LLKNFYGSKIYGAAGCNFNLAKYFRLELDQGQSQFGEKPVWSKTSLVQSQSGGSVEQNQSRGKSNRLYSRFTGGH